ncbi:hypothetical protein JHK82_044486 [Glycine max]|nr:hypothetical protein JHK82_044486 [Glycine max]
MEKAEEVKSKVFKQGQKTRASVAGVTSINLAEYVPAAVDKETEIVCIDQLCVFLHHPVLLFLHQLCLRRVKFFADYVSTGRAKKASSKDEGSDGRSSNRSEDFENRYTSDVDSLDNDAAIKSEVNEEDSCVRHSLSYETLAFGNYAGGSPYSGSTINGKHECWIYYSSQKSDYGGAHVENYNTCDQVEHQNSKHRILSWRKRKLHFRSSKVKGELLLKKNTEKRVDMILTMIAGC